MTRSERRGIAHLRRLRGRDIPGIGTITAVLSGSLVVGGRPVRPQIPHSPAASPTRTRRPSKARALRAGAQLARRLREHSSWVPLQRTLSRLACGSLAVIAVPSGAAESFCILG